MADIFGPSISRGDLVRLDYSRDIGLFDESHKLGNMEVIGVDDQGFAKVRMFGDNSGKENWIHGSKLRLAREEDEEEDKYMIETHMIETTNTELLRPRVGEEKEEVEMPNNKLEGSRASAIIGAVNSAAVDSGKRGIDMAVSQLASEEIVRKFRDMAGDSWPSLFDREGFRHMAPFALALLIIAAVEVMGDQIPHSNVLMDRAKSSMDASAKDAFREGLELFRPFLADLATSMVGKESPSSLPNVSNIKSA